MDSWPLAMVLVFLFFAPSSCENKNSTPLGVAIVNYLEHK
jgi:hypothetical protein